MTHKHPGLLPLLLCTCLALAWPGQAGAEQGSVSVLKLSGTEVDEPMLARLQATLKEQVGADATKTVGGDTEMTIGEIGLTIGCEKISESCLSQVSEYVEMDMIVYGSVQRTEDIYLVNLGLFDLRTGKFIRRLEDRTIEGNEDEVVEVFGTLVQNLMQGDVGRLVIQSATGATGGGMVTLDGKELGQAPGTFEGLPLGEHIVAIQSTDGQRMEQKVVLRGESPSTVVVNFAAVQQDTPQTRADSRWLVPGWASVGVGVVGLGFGLYERSVAQAKNDELSADRFTSLAVGDAPSLTPEKASEFRDLRDERDQANTLALVGFSVGALALGVGGVMLYSAYSADEVSQDASVAPAKEKEGRAIAEVQVRAGLGQVDLSFSF